MDHLVILLDCGHLDPVAALAQRAAIAAGLDHGAADPHVTLVGHLGTRVLAALEGVAAATEPFTTHMATGSSRGVATADLNLHVPVVRTDALDSLQRRSCDALRAVGAQIAGWSEPELWSPHITLLDRGLDATRLARAVASLARRHHPSWRIPVDRVALTGGWSERARPRRVVRFGS